MNLVFKIAGQLVVFSFIGISYANLAGYAEHQANASPQEKQFAEGAHGSAHAHKGSHPGMNEQMGPGGGQKTGNHEGLKDHSKKPMQSEHSGQGGPQGNHRPCRDGHSAGHPDSHPGKGPGQGSNIPMETAGIQVKAGKGAWQQNTLITPIKKGSLLKKGRFS